MPLTPSGAALRRALVQPALLSGYRFEDERLVDDMLRDVAQERGTLPLLAFAMARLWEHDRERSLLTRRGYEEIGGVAGALAQHAEATLEPAVGATVSRSCVRSCATWSPRREPVPSRSETSSCPPSPTSAVKRRRCSTGWSRRAC